MPGAPGRHLHSRHRGRPEEGNRDGLGDVDPRTPGPGGKQTGTKEVAQGKSYDHAVKDISLPKYSSWPNYKNFLPMNIERYYDFWNRGI